MDIVQRQLIKWLLVEEVVVVVPTGKSVYVISTSLALPIDADMLNETGKQMRPG